ncbi:GIP, partial [Symbiodinium necroappetens]
MAIPETLTQLTQLTLLAAAAAGAPPRHLAPIGGVATCPLLAELSWSHSVGCSNETVSNIIQGLYNTKESNHGKPVYKKEGPQGSVTVLIYYWDERDGPSFNGWWFGPKVGGDQVWAYNAGNLGRENAMPPTSNWKVPWDGKVDEKLRISVGAPRRDPRDRERDLRDKREEEKRRREEEERRQREEARRRRQREEEQQREQAR